MTDQLLASFRFCSAYIHGEQLGTGDMAYHVKEHVLALEKYSNGQDLDEDRRACAGTIARATRYFAKERGNPWL